MKILVTILVLIAIAAIIRAVVNWRRSKAASTQLRQSYIYDYSRNNVDQTGADQP